MTVQIEIQTAHFDHKSLVVFYFKGLEDKLRCITIFEGSRESFDRVAHGKIENAKEVFALLHPEAVFV